MSRLITVNTKPVVSVRKTRDDLADQLYRQFKEAIVIGIYRPGDKFPTVGEWCDKLSLAPKTVHTAIRALGDEGLLLSARAQGTTVCEPPREAVLDIAELYITPGMEKLLQLGLNKSEAQAVLDKVLSNWYAPRKGDRRTEVRVAGILTVGTDRRGNDRRSATRKKK